MRKNTSTNIIDEPSTIVEMNDDFPISVPNSPTAEPPPNDIPLRASEHPELRCSAALGVLPNVLLLTLIDTIVLEGEGCCMHML